MIFRWNFTGTLTEELIPEFLSREVPQPVISGSAVKNKIDPGLIAIIEALSQIEKEPYHCKDLPMQEETLF
ncbi:MAG: hypothetical protein HXY52_04995 [Nitrospirae bacterium]|nr:hypothetical protein [Nitrospirota bacterium]